MENAQEAQLRWMTHLQRKETAALGFMVPLEERLRANHMDMIFYHDDSWVIIYKLIIKDSRLNSNWMTHMTHVIENVVKPKPAIAYSVLIVKLHVVKMQATVC